MAVALGDPGRAEAVMVLGISLLLLSVGLGLVGRVLLSAAPPARPVRRREPMPARQMPALRLSPAPVPPSRQLPTPTPLLPTPAEPPAHERVTEPGLPAIDALGEAPTGPASRDDARDFFTRPTRTIDAESLRQLRASAPTRPVRLAALAEPAPTTPLRRR